jgi:hypothetical protein
MTDEHYYIPVGVLRRWPVLEATLTPIALVPLADTPLAPVFAPAVAYVPVYASLEALRAEWGDVDYRIARASA